MSSKDRVKLHRAKKAAETFSKNYLHGVSFAKVTDYIKAKEQEYCQGSIAKGVEFSDVFMDGFIDHLVAKYNSEDGKYNIYNLHDAWKHSVTCYTKSVS